MWKDALDEKRIEGNRSLSPIAHPDEILLESRSRFKKERQI